MRKVIYRQRVEKKSIGSSKKTAIAMIEVKSKQTGERKWKKNEPEIRTMSLLAADILPVCIVTNRNYSHYEWRLHTNEHFEFSRFYFISESGANERGKRAKTTATQKTSSIKLTFQSKREYYPACFTCGNNKTRYELIQMFFRCR